MRGFLKTHLGTDILVGSWFFLIFSIEYFALELIFSLQAQYTDDETTDMNDYTSLTSSIAFVIGSVYFVWFSYPEQMASMYNITPEKISQMTWMERNFTANEILKATWFFLLAIIPYFVDAIYLTIDYSDSPEGYAYILGLCIVVAGLYTWVLSCKPENMIANDGRGSSIVYDSFLSKFCCCCDCCNCCARHLGSDFLFGLWFFMVFNVLFLSYAIYYLIAISVTSYIGWMWLTMALGFTVGTYLFILSSYPENMQTSYFWDYCLNPCLCGSSSTDDMSEKKGLLDNRVKDAGPQSGDSAAPQEQDLL